MSTPGTPSKHLLKPYTNSGDPLASAPSVKKESPNYHEIKAEKGGLENEKNTGSFAVSCVGFLLVLSGICARGTNQRARSACGEAPGRKRRVHPRRRRWIS